MSKPFLPQSPTPQPLFEPYLAAAEETSIVLRRKLVAACALHAPGDIISPDGSILPEES